MKALDTVIVDSNLDGRMMLRAAIQHAGIKGKAHLVNSLSEAQSQFQNGDELSLIFISSRLTQDGIGSYIRAAKKQGAARDAAFVILLPSNSDTTNLSGIMACGYDGCLLEPFSVDALQSVVALAERVKKQRMEERLRYALKLLVKEVADQVSYAADLKQRGYSASLSVKVLTETLSILRDFDKASIAVYHEELLEYFLSRENIEAPKSYRGVSQRLRVRILEKNMQQIKVALQAAA